jgi:hypothetical protein
MSVLEKIYKELRENKKNIENGNINGIPFPLEQFRDCIPIIQKKQYHLITAKQKNGKSQIANYIFVFQVLLYAYNNPDLITPKILYFNWEEGEEEIMERFMSYYLYVKTKKRYSPVELNSPDKERLLDDETLNILESEEYKKIFEFFDEHVEFCGDCKTTVAVDVKLKSYFRSHGDCIYKEAFYKDDEGITQKTRSVSEYKQHNENEFVFAIFDHASLIQPIRGETLFTAIGTLSKNCVVYKNIYKAVIILIQQQSKELGSLEASKQNRVRPDDTFLSDNKSTVNDCTHFWGICDPVTANINDYLGYDLRKLGHNIRVFELIYNRKGMGNKISALFFDGAVNYFYPLPRPDNQQALEPFYKQIDKINKK